MATAQVLSALHTFPEPSRNLRVGTFCSVMATMDPGTTDFRLSIDALNFYMASNSLPSEMQQRARDYFHRTKHLWSSNASHQVRRPGPPRPRHASVGAFA